MKINSLYDFIKILEEKQEILKIKEYCSTNLEIIDITDRISKSLENNKALLFENNGTEFPLLINLFGSTNRTNIALNIREIEEIQKKLQDIFALFTDSKIGKLKKLLTLRKFNSYIPKISSKKASCQEIINKNPNINIFPILKCWQFDGGKFITLPCVVTKHPVSKIRNVGMYRMQVIDDRTTAMHWHLHKTGANHYEWHKKMNKKMPVAVFLGGHPLLTYSATAPLPENVDELTLAAFLMDKKINLTKCITQDIEVPSEADIVIEGYIDPNEELFEEGPFGDHTGFYSLKGYYPKFHITCITHRKNAIYPATIVGIPPQEDFYLGNITEKIFLPIIQKTIAPEILDWYMPAEGVAHNLIIVKIEKTYPGQAQKIASALWGAGQMMFNKTIVIVDENTDINSYQSLEKAIIDNFEPSQDIMFAKGPLDILDHAANEYGFGSKMLIDATKKANKREYNLDKIFNKASIIDKYPFADIYEEPNYVIIKINKEKKHLISQITGDIAEICNFKFIIFVDNFVDVKEKSILLWFILSNIDPIRDCKIIKNTLIVDATTKNKNYDNFPREWPNVIISDSKTIENIDKKWEKLNIGKLIPSPSLKFKSFVRNEGEINNGN